MSKVKKVILGIFILVIMVIVFNSIRKKIMTNDKYILKYLTEKYDGIEFERVGDYEEYFYKYKQLILAEGDRETRKIGLKKIFRPVGEEGEEFLVYQYYSGEIKDEYEYEIYIGHVDYIYNEYISTANQRKASKVLYEFLNPKIEELLEGIEYNIIFYLDENPSELTLEDYFEGKSYDISFKICVSKEDLKEENLIKYYKTAEGVKNYIESKII